MGDYLKLSFILIHGKNPILANRIQQFFASCTIKASQDSLNHVSGKIALRVIRLSSGRIGSRRS